MQKRNHGTKNRLAVASALLAAGALALSWEEGVDESGGKEPKGPDSAAEASGGTKGEGRAPADPTGHLFPKLPQEERFLLFDWAERPYFRPAGKEKDDRSDLITADLIEVSWDKCGYYYRPNQDPRRQEEVTDDRRVCREDFPAMVAENMGRIGYEVAPEEIAAVTWEIAEWVGFGDFALTLLYTHKKKLWKEYSDHKTAWMKQHGLWNLSPAESKEWRRYWLKRHGLWNIGDAADPVPHLLPQLSTQDRIFTFLWAGGGDMRSKDGEGIGWRACLDRKIEQNRDGVTFKDVYRESPACTEEFPRRVAANMAVLGYKVQPEQVVNLEIAVWMKEEQSRAWDLPDRLEKVYGTLYREWKESHNLPLDD